MSVPAEARQDKAQPTTKAERAYHEIRRLIANGSIRPGTVFDQEQLARDLKMSTTPLRETLRRLESEGFVQLSPHRDVHVRQLSAQEMRDLYQVRIVLEPHAARLAALGASDADINALQREIERTPKRAPDLAEHYQKVHQLLYSGCGNRFLVAVLDRVNDRIGRYRAMFVPLDPDMLELIGSFHARASAAFAARDGDALEAIVRDHLENAMHGFGERADFQSDNVGAESSRQRAGGAR